MKSLVKIALASLLITLSSLSYSEDEPLQVGVANFFPPFVTRSSLQSFMGFDINMMNYICKVIHRDCQAA